MEGKKVLLGVCGSIAAYKSTLLVRLLVKAGCDVKVVMTPAAKDFITPLTLATLSKFPVAIDFVKNDQGEWENHVELGLWADLMIVAPISANSLAKFAHGYCDNLLSATYLSAKCPVMVAPAMDLDMYQHPATRANLQTLSSHGNTVLEAEYGELASGLVGSGRMAEPEFIFDQVRSFFQRQARFQGKVALITAGPTYERIDPVRFIGNHSSGKMGVSLAKALAGQGALVTLVAGPGVANPMFEGIRFEAVQSAEEMYQAVADQYEKTHLAIFAAAVADYRPKDVAPEKIKKSGHEMNISLVKNKDIAAEMGKLKRNGQFNVGFALETENEEQNALGKLKKKNFDLIVLNSLNDPGAGFSGDTNKITIFGANDYAKSFPVKNKSAVAEDILDAIYDKISQ